MALPLAHLADHWSIYIAYSMPAIVVIVAIVASAIRERARVREEGDAGAPSAEESQDADRARP